MVNFDYPNPRTYVSAFSYDLSHYLMMYILVGKVNKKTLNRNCFVVYGTDPWNNPDTHGLMFCAKWTTGNFISMITIIQSVTMMVKYVTTNTIH